MYLSEAIRSAVTTIFNLVLPHLLPITSLSYWIYICRCAVTYDSTLFIIINGRCYGTLSFEKRKKLVYFMEYISEIRGLSRRTEIRQNNKKHKENSIFHNICAEWSIRTRWRYTNDMRHSYTHTKLYNYRIYIHKIYICIHSEISMEPTSFYDHPIDAHSFPAISRAYNKTGRELNHLHSQTRLLAIRVNWIVFTAVQYRERDTFRRSYSRSSNYR